MKEGMNVVLCNATDKKIAIKNVRQPHNWFQVYACAKNNIICQ